LTFDFEDEKDQERTEEEAKKMQRDRRPSIGIGNSQPVPRG